MINKRRLLFAGSALGLVLYAFVNSGYTSAAGVMPVQDGNEAPLVRISNPLKNSSYDRDALIRYEVSVSDKEDGESKYQEIPANEIFIKVKYLPDTSKVRAYLKQEDLHDTAALGDMLVSNCFNCHAVKTKVIGPSFQDISKRYPHNAAAAELLEKRIKDGATGMWGPEVMPRHPELSETQLKNMVQWIQANTEDPDIDYYAGAEGAVKPIAKAPGILVFTAGYRDHGSKEDHTQKRQGYDAVVVQVK